MIVTIASGVADAVLAHAAAALPQEACGLLLGHPGQITDARPTRNTAATPATRFEIDPTQLLATHREARGLGLQVVGHYHSHPGGQPQPSKRDAARAVQNGQLWLIAAGTTLTAWHATQNGPLHGRFAPVTLEPA